MCCTDICFKRPADPQPLISSTSPRGMALAIAFSTLFLAYFIPCRKLFSLIFLLLAILIAFVKSSLAPKASILSCSSIPAGKSMDCSSSGTLRSCKVPWELAFSARAALEARRRCFFDFAI